MAKKGVKKTKAKARRVTRPQSSHSFVSIYTISIGITAVVLAMLFTLHAVDKTDILGAKTKRHDNGRRIGQLRRISADQLVPRTGNSDIDQVVNILSEEDKVDRDEINESDDSRAVNDEINPVMTLSNDTTGEQ